MYKAQTNYTLLKYSIHFLYSCNLAIQQLKAYNINNPEIVYPASKSSSKSYVLMIARSFYVSLNTSRLQVFDIRVLGNKRILGST